MSSIPNTIAAEYKKCHSLSVTDCFGNSYLFVRTGKDRNGNDRWANIAKNEVNTDGHIDDNDGLVPNAVPFHAEEVAYLVAQAEEYNRRVASAEASLRDYVEFRRAWSRKPNKKGKLLLQKKEVSK